MEQTTPLPTCPMAETCKGTMERPFSGAAMIVPGIVFILLGILVLVEPRIIAWLLAIAFILIGAMLLVMANVMRKMGRRLMGS